MIRQEKAADTHHVGGRKGKAHALKNNNENATEHKENMSDARLPQVAAAAERDRRARYWLGLPQRLDNRGAN